MPNKLYNKKEILDYIKLTSDMHDYVSNIAKKIAIINGHKFKGMTWANFQLPLEDDLEEGCNLVSARITDEYDFNKPCYIEFPLEYLYIDDWEQIEKKKVKDKLKNRKKWNKEKIKRYIDFQKSFKEFQSDFSEMWTDYYEIK